MSMVPFTTDPWMHIAQITNDKCTNARYVQCPWSHSPWSTSRLSRSTSRRLVLIYQQRSLSEGSSRDSILRQPIKRITLYTGVHVFTHTDQPIKRMTVHRCTCVHTHNSTHYVRCPLSPNAPPAQVGAPKFPPNTFGTFPTLPSVQTSTKVALNWTNTSRQKNTHTQTNEDTDQMRHKHDYSETH